MVDEPEQEEASGDVGADAVRAQVGDDDASDIESLGDSSRRRLRKRDAEQRVTLRGVWSWVLLVALIIQMAIVHIAFFAYGITIGWDIIDSQVWIAYLATTLGETIALAHVVVRHLFPPLDE